VEGIFAVARASKAWEIAIASALVALGSVAACSSSHHGSPADGGADAAVDVAEEEAESDVTPPDVGIPIDARSIYTDACAKLGLVCEDNSQCCSTEYCDADGGCQLATRQQ
jgi:hypothetical protein